MFSIEQTVGEEFRNTFLDQNQLLWLVCVHLLPIVDSLLLQQNVKSLQRRFARFFVSIVESTGHGQLKRLGVESVLQILRTTLGVIGSEVELIVSPIRIRIIRTGTQTPEQRNMKRIKVTING
jgi:hypothetical protein